MGHPLFILYIYLHEIYSLRLKKQTNGKYTFLPCAIALECTIATRGSHYSAPKAGKVTYVNDTRFPTAPRILGSRHYIFVFLPWTLDN